jgi:hypothetical protein
MIMALGAGVFVPVTALVMVNTAPCPIPECASGWSAEAAALNAAMRPTKMASVNIIDKKTFFIYYSFSFCL